MANSVPLGQAGTGAAVILNSGKATNTYLNNLENIKQQKALQQKQQELLAQKQAEQLASDWKDNALKASKNVLYADQLAPIEKAHIEKGLQYAKAGRNIYDINDPDYATYQAERRKIESLRNVADRNEKMFTETLPKLGEYDPEDVKAYNDFFKGDITQQEASGAVPPALQKRFDQNKALTGVGVNYKEDEKIIGGNKVKTTSIDRPSTEKSIIANIAQQEGGERFLNKLTGGMPIKELQSLPKTKEEIRKGIELDFEGNPELKQVASQNGLIKGTKKYNEWLDNQTEDLYAKKTKFDNQMDSWYNSVANGVRESQSTTPTISPSLAYRMNRDAEKASNTQLGEPTRQSFKGNDILDPETSKVAQKAKSIYSDKFLSYDGGTVSIPQTDGVFNVQTQTTGRMPAIGSANITGLGYFPHTDGKQRLMMSVVDDGVEYLIPDNKIPQDLKNSDKYNAVRNKLGDTTRTQQSKQSQGKKQPKQLPSVKASESTLSFFKKD